MKKYTLKDQDMIMEDSQEKKYVLKIRDMLPEDKPREKLLSDGVEALSCVELLAVVLGTGTKKEEVFVMSERILKEYGEKTLANNKNPKKINGGLDIPLAKACQIVATFELGRRFFQKNENGLAQIRTAKEAFEYLKEIGRLPKEHFRGIYLNSHFKVIHDETISVGSLTANVVHPREVFKPAIEYSAAAVIVAHNHPSGDPTPSESDIAITKQLVEAGKILGIELLDHIIIAKDSYKIIK
ncbi:MAG: DNA repair protein RadC [Parcubacteria group bacterium]|jgi:DNA repair protein RadC